MGLDLRPRSTVAAKNIGGAQSAKSTEGFLEKFQHAPNEIWLLIFRHATSVPHALNPNADDPFDFPGTPINPESLTRWHLQAALRTKRTIVLVCRLWYDLGIPLLYEAVAARSDKSLERLRDTLVAPTSFSKAGAANRKLRIRRLDLFPWKTYASKPSCRVLEDIFSRTPELEIFSESGFSFAHPPSETGIDALISGCATSLRKCILYTAMLGLTEYTALIGQCPRLSCLYVGTLIFMKNDATPLPENSSLTRLSIKCPMLSSPLTSLQEIHIRPEFAVPEALDAFFRIQGPRLRTIYCDMLSRNGYSSRTVESYLGLCTRYCLNLTRLIFVFPSWDRIDLPAPIPFPPTVTHLGIYTTSVPSPLGLDDFLEHASNLIRHQETVPRVIRRLNPSTPKEWDYLQENKLRALRHSSPICCRIEDADGNDLALQVLTVAEIPGSSAHSPWILLNI
ncbi:hypothetical protein DENSPDRAFT_619832 [Dentipellis sp. KUC8613]|nr:hypothetical protein DENSPDRAFT_619832 [Dentipellis sp. KUC8613]